MSFQGKAARGSRAVGFAFMSLCWSAVAPTQARSAVAAPCAGVLPPTQIAGVDRIAGRALREQRVSGLTLGIARRGTLLFACGYGLRDRADHLRADAATVYPIGSITKQFTATAVMLLAANGQVDINAHLAKYLPTAPHGRELTVHNLLDQTSGLPDYVEALPLNNLNSPLLGLSPRQYVAMVTHKPLHFRPGSKYEYSNTNYLLLGMLIAAVAREPYPVFVCDKILDPQRLSSTRYLARYRASGPDVAHGYDYEKRHFIALPDLSMAWGNAAGALASTVGDLIRWDGAFFGGRVVSAAVVRTMTTPPKLVHPATKFPLLRGYAFGWVNGIDKGHRLIWHNGGIPGASAMNVTFPDNGLEVIVLTNVSDGAPEKTALLIARFVGE